MSKIKSHVKAGDTVEVITGNKAIKGKRGNILDIRNSKKGTFVTVEGVRMIKKAVRPTEENREGGIEEMEGPIHISNVKKVD